VAPDAFIVVDEPAQKDDATGVIVTLGFVVIVALPLMDAVQLPLTVPVTV